MKQLIKKFFKKLWSWVIIWLWFILSIWIFIIVYAAWRSVMTPVWTWSWLTANSWNQMIDNLNDLNGRLLWVSNVWGNVWIGTAGPLRALHIKSSAGTAQIESTSNNSSLYFGDTSSTVIDNQGIGSRGNNISIIAGWADKLTVLNSWNVWIWTTTPAWKLDVNWAIAIHSVATNTLVGRIQMENNLFKIITSAWKQWDFRDDGTIWFYDWNVWTKKSL